MLRRGTRERESPGFDPARPPAIAGVTGLTLIGGGGSATVYQGAEPAMRRKVAVKVVHALVREARERQAFERECALAGQVGEHPYAADVYRGGFAGDRPFLIMRYYPRGSLAGSLGAAAHRLPVDESLAICARVATALHFAHSQGILHRDVKPENILCDAFGDPVLADFGIATERDSATMTMRHAMTPAYAPPEVLRDGGGWPHSDVWSLAATLYALLNGHPPFYDPRQGDPRANMRALTGPLPPVNHPGVSAHLQQTLARALIGEPDRRTGSARRLAEELNTDLHLLGLAPVPLRFDAPDDTRWPASPVSGTAGHRTGPPPVIQPAAAGGAGSRADPALTGYLSTSQAFRIPETGPPARRRVPPSAAVTAGAVLLVLVFGVAYLLTGSRQAPRGAHGPPGVAAGAPAAAATASASARARTAVPAPSPPTDVAAAAVNGSQARISWKNTASFQYVVISLGNGPGIRTRAFPNRSPQLFTGLDPGKPYCFAVGYEYDPGAKPPAYSVVTGKACINGGVPEPGG